MDGRHIRLPRRAVNGARSQTRLLWGLTALLLGALGPQPCAQAQDTPALETAGEGAGTDDMDDTEASEAAPEEATPEEATVEPPPAPEPDNEPASATVAPEDEEEDEEPPPDVAVLSVGGDASRSQARRTRQAVAAALVAEGMTPVPDADVALRVPPSALSACGDAACAYGFAESLNVRMVAVVTTWAGESGPSSLTVSLLLGRRRSHSATEDVGDDGLQRAATRAVRGAQDARRQALLVSGVSAEPDDPSEDEIDPEDDGREENFLNRDRPLEQWVLPSLLGVVGIGLVGTAVYALLDETCDRFSSSMPEVCLRGSRPNYGLGILFSVTGVLSIAGAVLWLAVGGEPAQTGNIVVVFNATATAAIYTGQF
ncbi:MAG: hypothetical protein AB8I08_14180 [Sandaracinaceae bacterium]